MGKNHGGIQSVENPISNSTKPIPANGQIVSPTFTELADGADAVTPQPGKVGLEEFGIPTNGTINTTFNGDGLAGD